MFAKTRTDSKNARKMARPPKRGIGTLCCGRRIGVVGIVWTMRELRGELFEQCFLIHTARPP